MPFSTAQNAEERLHPRDGVYGPARQNEAPQDCLERAGEKRASGEAGDYGLRNRMPYFMVCLEDQLGLRHDAPHSS